jgi:hypothetical protein
VNLLVHRLRLSPRGVTFTGRRADEEQASEFLASTDPWFRPVQVRTGPDGCLWVVDMYRFVIEHPRWIPPEDLAKLDVRAGHDMGRIYRVRPRDRQPRPVPRLDKLDTPALVAALDSANGWQRDLAGQMLLWKADQVAVRPLEVLAGSCPRAETRLHALCILDRLGRLTPNVLLAALTDEHPGVRRYAVRLAETRVGQDPAALGSALLKRVNDPDPQVRLQLAYTLGAWDDSRAARALAALLLRDPGEPFLLAAALSSVKAANIGEVATGILASPGQASPPAAVVQRLLGLATAWGDRDAMRRLLGPVIKPQGGRFAA